MNTEFKPATPKDAASVILLRDGKIVWARRNPKLSFLGGFHAFPGGKTDPGDLEIKVANCEDTEMSAMIGCAVREAFEEVGVLLVRGGEKLTKGQRVSLHDDLISGRSTFAEILDHWGLWIDGQDFKYTGFWTTPQFSPVRFKTRFFVADLPSKQNPHAAISELQEIEIVTAREALDRWRRSEVLITPPVLIHLNELVGDAPMDLKIGNLRKRSDEQNGDIYHIDINPRIAIFPVRTKTLPPATHTNCFIVGKREFAVIDAASPFPEEQSNLHGLIDEHLDRGFCCRAIIVSHLHRDHFGGESALRDHLREKYGLKVPILGHRITAADLEGAVAFDGFLEDHERISLKDADGEVFDLEILHTPGHARGHLAFYEPGLGFLLSSDNVVGFGTVVIAPPQGDMAEYLRSLERMRDLPGLRFLAGSHGAAVFNARGRIQEYIDHRIEREQQVIEQLSLGNDSPESIAAEIYRGLDPKLIPLAEATVAAHLEKIRKDRSFKIQNSKQVAELQKNFRKS